MNFDGNFDGNLMGTLMMDSRGWPYDSFDCLSLLNRYVQTMGFKQLRNGRGLL